MLAQSLKNTEERESVVNSGASMHMLSKKELSSGELETLRKSRNPRVVPTANGAVHTHEEAQVFVHDLILFVRILNIGLMKSGRASWQEEEATRKDFNILLIHQDKIFFYLRALQGQSGRNLIDPSLQDNVLIPNNFIEYICHIGCAINSHSIKKSGLTPGGQNLSKRQTVFFTSVDLMNKEHKDPEEVNLHAPRLTWYKQKVWKKHQDTVYWVDMKLAQQKGFKCYQTISNAIILYDTLPAYCIPKAVMMETGEIIYEKVFASPRPPPRFLIKIHG